MFAEQKKDFYSVNADIAIEANQQQRNHEYGQRAGLIQQEYANLSGNYDESQNQTHDMDGQYGSEAMQHELAQQQQMQLMMLDETMTGPQAVRYDEVYYPRTDKRSISKCTGVCETNLNVTLLGFECRGKPVHLQGKRVLREDQVRQGCLRHCEQRHWQPRDWQKPHRVHQLAVSREDLRHESHPCR